MEPKFIVVEGLDGVGKTEVSKIISKCGYEYFKTPSGAFELVREIFDNDNISREERAAFYTSSCLYISDKIEQILDNGGKVVLDRYNYSTLAYHFYDQTNIEFKHKIKKVFTLIRKPDLIILIKARYEKIIDRLAKRETLQLNDKFILNETKFYSIQNSFTRFFNAPYLVLDGTQSIDLIRNSILEIIGGNHEKLCRL